MGSVGKGEGEIGQWWGREVGDGKVAEFSGWIGGVVDSSGGGKWPQRNGWTHFGCLNALDYLDMEIR